MATYVPARYPKDFASTLLTVSCCEAVLLHDQLPSPHAWEAREYGSKKREPHSYSGPKTRGCMARNRSGQVVVSFTRMEEWEDGREEVTSIRQSPLWEIVRTPRQMTADEWKRLEPTSRMASQKCSPLLGIERRLFQDEMLLQRLACCRTFDAIAVLASLHLEAKADGREEFAFLCARYLPIAIGLLGPAPIARRTSLLLFASLRLRLLLDDVEWKGKVLELSAYDIPLLQTHAKEFPPVHCTKRNFLGYQDLIVSEAHTSWLKAHLPPTRSAMGARRRKAWANALSPRSHPDGPCDPHFWPAYHPDALSRFQSELGKFF